MNKAKFLIFFLAICFGNSAFGMQRAFRSPQLTVLAKGIRAHSFKAFVGVQVVGYSLFLARANALLRHEAAMQEERMLIDDVVLSCASGDVIIDL